MPDRRPRRQSSAPHPTEGIGGQGGGCTDKFVPGHAVASTGCASSQTATRSGGGITAASSSGRQASRSERILHAQAAERLRRDAHRALRMARPTFAKAPRGATGQRPGFPQLPPTPLAALTPTRTPVKLPGPFTTTMPPRSRISTPEDLSRSPTAETSVAEYVRPASSIWPRISRSRPGMRPSATEPEGPQVSIARTGAETGEWQVQTAASAWSRSAMRSSLSSMPMERRMRPSLMPIERRTSSLTEPCVVVAE